MSTNRAIRLATGEGVIVLVAVFGVAMLVGGTLLGAAPTTLRPWDPNGFVSALPLGRSLVADPAWFELVRRRVLDEWGPDAQALVCLFTLVVLLKGSFRPRWRRWLGVLVVLCAAPLGAPFSLALAAQLGWVATHGLTWRAEAIAEGHLVFAGVGGLWLALVLATLRLHLNDGRGAE